MVGYARVIYGREMGLSILVKQCAWCGGDLTERQVRAGNRFCGTSCSAKWRMRQPEIVAKVHTKEIHAVIGRKVSAWLHSNDPKAKANIERIRLLNPAASPLVRLKLSQTLRRIGHKPKIRGGNGRGLTIPQSMLLGALGNGWVAEYPVSLGKRLPNYPTAYKVDLACVSMKIAIEVDGYSHVALARQIQDAKKEAKLRELGWTVLRFTNRMILSSLDTVMQQVLLYSMTSK